MCVCEIRVHSSPGRSLSLFLVFISFPKGSILVNILVSLCGFVFSPLAVSNLMFSASLKPVPFPSLDHPGIITQASWQPDSSAISPWLRDRYSVVHFTRCASKLNRTQKWLAVRFPPCSWNIYNFLLSAASARVFLGVGGMTIVEKCCFQDIKMLGSSFGSLTYR